MSGMNPITLALKGAIQVYRYTFRPILAPSCRFEPSCSAYALEALSRHGPLRGTLLSAWRILRCNPWGGMGEDPVPAPRHEGGARRTDARQSA